MSASNLQFKLLSCNISMLIIISYSFLEVSFTQFRTLREKLTSDFFYSN